MDVTEAYRRSLAYFTDRVRDVGPRQWDGPTPCADWDVRGLVNHVVYETRWAVPLFRGATIADVGDRFEGDLLGTDPVAAATEAAAEAEEAVAEPGAMERTVHLSFGPTPAAEYARQLIAEHVVHGWDLAAAVGADRTVDPDLVRECAAWWAGMEDAYRQGGAVGPRTEVPGDASEHDRLLAAFGRDPNWRAS